MIYIREDYPVLKKKNIILANNNASLKLEIEKHVEKERQSEDLIKSLKDELEKVKRELNNEKKKAEDLASDFEQVALTAVVKTRGELMTEYKEGKYVDWDVDGEIETYCAHMGLDVDSEGAEKLEDASVANIEEAAAEIHDFGATKDCEEPHANA
ncbi:uncharacterized protein LOC133796291 isoform X3 [Humulus lupulus]|uniref:uncharacterized protein LOC133796291 isoform X3 n=1 Tax=Humulus lupulus TaxID=3486 RepID=UPI002B41593A|nr:uncharacterized protein LOC133796291 isoform X3 [Humulus lupulus]